AEDGIRDFHVTGVQTCALPISTEVEHVLATQCLVARKTKSMLIKVEGETAPGVTAKDIVLAIIGRIGSGGGSGYSIEYAGSAIRSEERRVGKGWRSRWGAEQ